MGFYPYLIRGKYRENTGFFPLTRFVETPTFLKIFKGDGSAWHNTSMARDGYLLPKKHLKGDKRKILQSKL
jgi:hypothetical protein